MAETMTNETLNRIDDNNSKAKEIVKSAIDLLVNNDDTDTDPIVLLGAASDYLTDNDKILNAIM